jgi:3-oxoacyl-[acyl-carrier protein] reductase
VWSRGRERLVTISNGLLLEGKRVLIVGGGGGGVGHAITLAVASAGASVAVVDVRHDAAEGAAKDARASGGPLAVPLVADARDGEAIERVVADANDAMSGIDALVTSLGGLMAFNIPFVRLHEFGEADWDTVFDLNIRYVFRVLRPVLRIMLAQGIGGTIVSIGSDGGTAGHGSPHTAAYGAAKAGLAHLTKTVAVEYGRDGIRMNMVSPGPTATSSVAGVSEDVRDGMNLVIPLGRQGTPMNIADAVVFMLSDMSAHVSGQILGVDGGLSVQRPMPSFANIYGQK